MILATCVDITQINRVILPSPTLVINIVFRGIGLIELLVQHYSLLIAFIAFRSVFTLGLVVFIRTGWEISSFIQKFIMVFWASLWAGSITFISLDTWIAQKNAFQVPFIIVDWKRIFVSFDNLLSQMSDKYSGVGVTCQVEFVLLKLLESGIESS